MSLYFGNYLLVIYDSMTELSLKTFRSILKRQKRKKY